MQSWERSKRFGARTSPELWLLCVYLNMAYTNTCGGWPNYEFFRLPKVMTALGYSFQRNPSTMSNNRTVTITDNTGKSVECPIIEGTHGAPVINISGLYPQLGMFTHDPGFGATSACRSTITTSTATKESPLPWLPH